MSFGERLKQLREQKGLIQQDIADLLKVGRATIAGYETKGKQPDYEKLNKLADFFNVSIDYLLGRELTQENKTYEQERYIESLKLDTAEDAIKFILQQPSIMEFGGYNLNEMSKEEILDLANDLLFAMKLSLEKNKMK